MDLHRSEVTRFNNPGPLAIGSKIKCGKGGDIYALYSTTQGKEAWISPIRKVSVSSKSVTEYVIPSIDGYEKLSRVDYDVSADGTLYELVQAYPKSGSDKKPEPVHMVVKYKDDGQLDSYFILGEVPGKHFRPTSIDMFGAENSLVSGITIQKTPEGAQLLGVFSAVFDRSGTFRNSVTLTGLATPTESSTAPSSKDSSDLLSLASSLLGVSSPDGNIYLLQKNHLDVVSLSGSIDHDFPLSSPADKLSPTQMAWAGGGNLFISYDHFSTGEPDEGNKYRTMLIVVDPFQGKVINIYRIPSDETDFAVPACAASVSDFLFLSADDHGSLAVVHYVPK